MIQQKFNIDKKSKSRRFKGHFFFCYYTIDTREPNISNNHEPENCVSLRDSLHHMSTNPCASFLL